MLKTAVCWPRARTDPYGQMVPKHSCTVTVSVAQIGTTSDAEDYKAVEAYKPGILQ